MVNAEELLKGMDIPEESKAKLIESLTPVLTKYEADVADANGKLQEAISTRQKAKDELRELKAKFVDGDYDGKKALEDKIKEKETELISYAEKTKTLQQELEVKNKELETIETETRQTLKDRFAEDKWEVIKDLPLAKLRELAKLETINEPPAGDRTKGIKTYGSGSKNLSSEEKIAKMYEKK